MLILGEGGTKLSLGEGTMVLLLGTLSGSTALNNPVDVAEKKFVPEVVVLDCLKLDFL